MTMKIDKTSGSVKRMSVDQYVRERKKHKKQGAFDEILQQEVTKLKSGRKCAGLKPYFKTIYSIKVRDKYGIHKGHI